VLKGRNATPLDTTCNSEGNGKVLAGEIDRWCWVYLVQNVGEARREVDREHDKDNVTFWIAQRA